MPDLMSFFNDLYISKYFIKRISSVRLKPIQALHKPDDPAGQSPPVIQVFSCFFVARPPASAQSTESNEAGPARIVPHDSAGRGRLYQASGRARLMKVRH